jgi:hypothetical protein
MIPNTAPDAPITGTELPDRMAGTRKNSAPTSCAERYASRNRRVPIIPSSIVPKKYSISMFISRWNRSSTLCRKPYVKSCQTGTNGARSRQRRGWRPSQSATARQASLAARKRRNVTARTAVFAIRSQRVPGVSRGKPTLRHPRGLRSVLGRGLPSSSPSGEDSIGRDGSVPGRRPAVPSNAPRRGPCSRAASRSSSVRRRPGRA